AADVCPKTEEGYLYFRDPNSVWGPLRSMNMSNVWTFAACKKSHLVEVTADDLRAVFCAADEFDKGKNSFGADWQSAEITTLRVRPGEVILARHFNQESKIYAVEITRQTKGHLQARYIEVVRC